MNSARYAGAAPVTAGLSLVPGGGTTHSPLGESVLDPPTAATMPAWGGGTAPLGRLTVRLTTTPEPPVAAMAVAYVSLAGIRVCVLVKMGHVVPGRIFCVNGVSGPDGRRKSTVTDSVVFPGLNTSISVAAPGTS